MLHLNAKMLQFDGQICIGIELYLMQHIHLMFYLFGSVRDSLSDRSWAKKHIAHWVKSM